ncbi:MAG: tyrosine-type recombinase/integrase, partial [Capnocytophaga sp.]|nr:tyrosine-type recombinase/integrase [Capnocytophaga sp.]
VKINTDWLIVYYAKVPAQDEFKRFRKRVPVIKPKSERMKYAKKMAAAINLKLEQGWSPFYEDTNVQYKSLEYCSELFLQMQEREVEDGIKRPDTLRAYTSNLALFSQYLKAKKIQLKFIIEIDTYLINNYLDYIFYEKRNSSSTYNNHLRFMFTFLEWCKSKRFVNQNAAESIKHKPKTQKTREVLTGDVKKLLRESKNDNFNYFVLCMLTYYCFVRRTELTKLKVSDVQLHKGFIIISGENSKNRKSESVTIPDAFMPDLAQHLATAQNSDFLFSANDFKAGKKQLSPKKISDEWDKFRKKHRLPNKYQFYSLKDTGITDLLNSGVPAIKVRDQARHHDLKITEAYTARNKFADEVVKSANFEF